MKKEEYINIAVNLSTDKNKLYKIRKNLFDNALNSPLFNKEKFSDEFFILLENIYNKKLIS